MSPAWISVRQAVPVSGGKHGTRNFKIQGIVSSIELCEQQQELIHYRAVLVPRLWRCTLTTQCRVFLDMDIKAEFVDPAFAKAGCRQISD